MQANQSLVLRYKHNAVLSTQHSVAHVLPWLLSVDLSDRVHPCFMDRNQADTCTHTGAAADPARVNTAAAPMEITVIDDDDDDNEVEDAEGGGGGVTTVDDTGNTTATGARAKKRRRVTLPMDSTNTSVTVVDTGPETEDIDAQSPRKKSSKEDSSSGGSTTETTEQATPAGKPFVSALGASCEYLRGFVCVAFCVYCVFLCVYCSMCKPFHKIG